MKCEPNDAERYQNLTGRLENGRSVIESQQRDVATIELELGLRLRESQRRDIPDQAEIDLLLHYLLHPERSPAAVFKNPLNLYQKLTIPVKNSLL